MVLRSALFDLSAGSCVSMENGIKQLTSKVCCGSCLEKVDDVFQSDAADYYDPMSG